MTDEPGSALGRRAAEARSAQAGRSALCARAYQETRALASAPRLLAGGVALRRAPCRHDRLGRSVWRRLDLPDAVNGARIDGHALFGDRLEEQIVTDDFHQHEREACVE